MNTLKFWQDFDGKTLTETMLPLKYQQSLFDNNNNNNNYKKPKT